MSDEGLGGDEEYPGLIYWRKINWSSLLPVLFLVALVAWFVAGGVRTGLTIYYGPVEFSFGSEQVANLVAALLRATAVLEVIAFRAWIAAGAVIGLLWLRSRST